MIKITIITILFVGCLSQALPEELGVLVLNDSNFDEAIKKYDFLLADFYAPWCGHWYNQINRNSKNLEPTYSELATQLSNNKNIIIAKVDATKHKIPDVQV